MESITSNILELTLLIDALSFDTVGRLYTVCNVIELTLHMCIMYIRSHTYWYVLILFQGYVDDMIQDIVDCVSWVHQDGHLYGADKVVKIS